MISVISPQFAKNKYLVTKLLEKYPNSKVCQSVVTDDDILSFCADAKVMVVGTARFIHLLDKLPNLKFISKMGVGTDNLDFPLLKERNIEVYLPPGGVNATAVAELTLRHILTLLRRINTTENILREKKIWAKLEGKQLSETTIGIIGYGNIGKKVAQTLYLLGAKLKIYDQRKFAVPEKWYAELDDVLFTSDVVTLHINGEGNTDFVDKKFIRKMKKGAYLVNMSRGNIVNIYDIINTIEDGQLGGAALDVFPNEPDIDGVLVNHPYITLSCHQGSSTTKTTIEMGEFVLESIDEFYEGYNNRK